MERFFNSLPDHPSIETFPRGVKNRNLNATAMWADPKKVAYFRTYTGHGLIFGKIGNDLISFYDDRHILTVAGSRAGKGRSAIIPNLLRFSESVIAIDVKGELARITGDCRGLGTDTSNGLGQDVYVFDPFRISGKTPSAFNPMDMLIVKIKDPFGNDIDNDNLIDDCALLADSLVVSSGGENAHWDETARELIKAIILKLALTAKPHEKNLITVRQTLRSSEKIAALFELSRLLLDNHRDRLSPFKRHAMEIVVGAGQAFLEKPEKERESVLSSARRQTEFLDSPSMVDSLSRTSGGFRFEQLRQKPTTLYLCLPAGRLATHYRWLRLMISFALECVEREANQAALRKALNLPASDPSPKVLFVLDEFPVLGFMERLMVAAGQVAGFGVKLWVIAQDISQLQKLYGQSWESFVGNAGVLQFFGNNDPTTLEFISKRLGETAIAQSSKAENDQNPYARHSSSWTITNHPLMTPEEIGRFFARPLMPEGSNPPQNIPPQKQMQILIVTGANPIALEMIRYDAQGESYSPLFEGRYGA